jgi:flagellar basal-body rod modification protein FlgD
MDDKGRASTGERTFDLNRTLAAPAAVSPALAVPRAVPRAVATFRLVRPATVVSRIKTTSGVVVRSLPRRKAAPGELEVAWDGLTDTGATAPAGAYLAEVTAINDVGRVTLGATFAVRRLPPPLPPKPAKAKRPRKKK